MTHNRLNRRSLLLGGIAGVAVIGAAAVLRPFTKHASAGDEAVEGQFEINLSDDEWKARLDAKQYDVLRHEATERPFSSPLNTNYAKGIYQCAGCDLPVYSSETKYDSGTGWPSFYDAMADAVHTKEDNSLFATRTEVHCRRCGGHFGHIFDDGPEPTGLRHCLNGVALNFIAAEA